MKARCERGAVAVEVALLTPLLVSLLLGLVDLGLIMNRQQDLEGAAREGARYATLVDDATRSDIVVHTTNALQDTDSVTVSLSPNYNQPCYLRSGQTVTVSILTYNTVELLFIGVSELELSSSAVFTCK